MARQRDIIECCVGNGEKCLAGNGEECSVGNGEKYERVTFVFPYLISRTRYKSTTVGHLHFTPLNT